MLWRFLLRRIWTPTCLDSYLFTASIINWKAECLPSTKSPSRLGFIGKTASLSYFTILQKSDVGMYRMSQERERKGGGAKKNMKLSSTSLSFCALNGANQGWVHPSPPPSHTTHTYPSPFFFGSPTLLLLYLLSYILFTSRLSILLRCTHHRGTFTPFLTLHKSLSLIPSRAKHD